MVGARRGGRWRIAAALACGLGSLGALATATGPGLALEENLGLAWLFGLRGERPPPREVAVVALDGRHVPWDLVPSCRDASRLVAGSWPRCHLARLTEELTRRGAEVIAFDVAFTMPGPPGGDRDLAAAFRAAGHVALLQKIEVDRVDAPGVVASERLLDPIPVLGEAAAGRAPFPLPKVPARVHQFWAFKESLGDRPTLPAVALQLWSRPVLPTFLELAAEAGYEGAEGLAPADTQGDAARLMQRLRRDLRGREDLGARIAELAASRASSLLAARRIQALAALYTGPDSHYANFFGRPGRVPTLRGREVLAGAGKDRVDLAGKVVFVGEAAFAAADRDGFYTVFSRDDGVDLSGVEIAATAFTNLLHRDMITQPPPWAVLAAVVTVGAVAGGLALFLPGVWAVLAVMGFAGLYVGGAYTLFVRQEVWLPLAVPLLVQAPLALLAGLLIQYRITLEQRRRAARAVRYYVPAEVAEAVTETGIPSARADLRYGALMATDLENYTAFSEKLPAEELYAYMNTYFAVLANAMTRHGALVTQTLADSMMGVWRGEPDDPGFRRAACLAALEVQAALDSFHASWNGHRHKTRIGLHAGSFALGHVGGGGHYNFTVTGDTANTASRLENLNKTLGTRTLVSAGVVAGLEADFRLRRLGNFILRGRSTPLTVHELCGTAAAEADPEQAELHRRFAAALQAAEAGAWAAATADFEDIRRRYPDDGPTHYWLGRCRQALAGTADQQETAGQQG